MRRREFLKTTLIFSLAGVTFGVILPACSDDDPEPTDTTTTSDSTDSTSTTDSNTSESDECTTTTNAIGTNHGHVVDLSDAQLAAGAEVVLDLTGAGHTHTVTLSAANLESLAACQEVSLASSNEAGHSHEITFTPLA